MNAGVRIPLDMEPAIEAHRRLGAWLESAQAHEMTADEMSDTMRKIVDDLQSFSFDLGGALLGL